MFSFWEENIGCLVLSTIHLKKTDVTASSYSYLIGYENMGNKNQ